jgi:aminoglycoside phosphotransferase (APT) family kinase protein
MLQKVRKGEELNTSALKLFLLNNGLISNIESDLLIQQYSNGYSNLTYLLKVEDQEFVLRKPPKGAVKRGHDMSREYKVLSRLHPTFAKAPKTFAYEADPNTIGSSFYVMEKMDGIILTYKNVKALDILPEDYKTIADSWLNAFVELHNLDYQSLGLSDLGRPEGYVERQVINWSKQYVNSAIDDLPAANFVMTWMLENYSKEYSSCLIHNDFKYDNIVFEYDDWKKVNAILDWEMCTIGDPMMDLGTSLGYWTMGSDAAEFSVSLPSPTIFEGNPGRLEIVEQYALKSGKSINNLIFYYVFGLFKIAVIAQQIFYRYNKGLTTNDKFAKLDKVCAFLCHMAQQAIQKKRIEHLF